MKQFVPKLAIWPGLFCSEFPSVNGTDKQDMYLLLSFINVMYYRKHLEIVISFVSLPV